MNVPLRANGGTGASGEHAVLVAVAEDELAGLDRPPAAVHDRDRDALAAILASRRAADRRLRESVAVAEVLALPAVRAHWSRPSLHAAHPHARDRRRRDRAAGADARARPAPRTVEHDEDVDVALPKPGVPVGRRRCGRGHRARRRDRPCPRGTRAGSSSSSRFDDAEPSQPSMAEGDVERRRPGRPAHSVASVTCGAARRAARGRRARVAHARLTYAACREAVALEHVALDVAELELHRRERPLELESWRTSGRRYALSSAKSRTRRRRACARA